MTAAAINRAELLALCEQGFVPESEWRNRDSSGAQRQLGEAYALLRAGCEFTVEPEQNETHWVHITFRGFGYFDWGACPDTETFYIPTAERLSKRIGKDWY